MFYSFLLGVILLLAAFIVRKTMARVGTPIMLIYASWGTLFLLYTCSPILLTSFSIYTFLLFAFGFLALYFGFLLGKNMKTKKSRIKRLSIKVNPSVLFTVFVVSLYLALIIMRIKLLQSNVGDIADLINSPFLIREASTSGTLSKSLIMALLEGLILPSVLLGIILIYSENKNWRLGFLPLIGMIAVQLTTMSRGLILSSLIIYTCFLGLRSNNKLGYFIKRAIIFSVAALLILQIIFLIRPRSGQALRYAEKSVAFRPWVPYEIRNNELLLSTITLINYATCGVHGFAHYSKDGLPEVDYSFGAVSFSGFLNMLYSVFNIKTDTFHALHSYDVIYYPSYTVVFTFFRQLYDDFGLIGMILMHLVWGYLIGKTYNKYLKRNYIRKKGKIS